MWSNFSFSLSYYSDIFLATAIGLYFLFSKGKKEKKGLKDTTEQDLGDIYDLVYDQPETTEENCSDDECMEDPILLQKNLIAGIKKIASVENIEIGIAAKDGLSLVTSSDKVDEHFLGISTGLFDYIKSRVFSGLKKISAIYDENNTEKTLHVLPILVHGDIDYLIIISDHPILKNEKVIIENILDHLKKYKFMDNTGDEEHA